MASNVGRGRGYCGKNKDIIRTPGVIPDNERFKIAKKTTPTISGDMYSDSPSEGERASQNVKTQPKQLANMEKASGGRSGTSKIHTIKGTDTGNESVKYSQDFLRTISVSDENRQSVLFIEEKHHFLLKQINLLALQDDGILFNQKLQHISEVITKHYQDIVGIRNAMDAIASAAILDSRISAKVSLLCCSLWFSSHHVKGQKLHNIFMEALTDKVDGLEVSLEGADQYLVNTATLLSNIFTETKMLTPEELRTIARLIVQVSIELLECHTPLALKTLNIQLMVHGRKLYQSVPDKVESLSISARKLLIARQPPPPSCRIWLTLLADQCLCRLEPLPKYLEDFYSVHLDESQNNFEEKTVKKKCDLNNYSDVKNANTRYGDKSRQSDSSDIYSAHSNGDKNVEYDQRYSDDVFEDRNIQHDSSFDSSGVSDANNSENYDCHNVSQNSERKPRPILGAGARFGHTASALDPCDGNTTNQSADENIPLFCPTIPPPNFATKPGKQVTSASQDNIDYWNTPPPPIPNNRKKEPAIIQSSSILSKRLDLNSWRVESNGTSAEGKNIEVCENHESDVISDNVESCEESEESSTSKLLLDKISADSMLREYTNKHQHSAAQRSEKKRAEQVFYERKQGGHSARESTSNIDNWDEGEISNLRLSKPTQETDKARDKLGSDRNPSYNERRNTNREFGRHRSEKTDKPGSNGDQRQKKLSDEDKDISDERRPRHGGKREQRASGGRNRDSLEVHRGASYWTHDDRCDKEYDD